MENNNETDLVVLLRLIKGGIKSFFNAIKEFVTSLIIGFIRLLARLYNQKLLILIPIVICGVIGYFYNIKSSDFCENSFTVRANHGAGKDLLRQINFMNRLIENKEIEELSALLGVHDSMTMKLMKIEIAPIITIKEKYEIIMDIFDKSDSAYMEIINVEQIMDEISTDMYKEFTITVYLKKDITASFIEDAIVNSVKDNSYYQSLEETTIKTLEYQKQQDINSIAAIDTLLHVINYTEKRKANLSLSARTLIANSASNMIEMDSPLSLINRRQKLVLGINKVDHEINLNREIINVTSHFNSNNIVVDSIYNNQLKLGLLVGLIIGLSLAFLSMYKDKIVTVIEEDDFYKK